MTHYDAKATLAEFQKYALESLKEGDTTAACQLILACKSLSPQLAVAIARVLRKHCRPNHRPPRLDLWLEDFVVRDAREAIMHLQEAGMTKGQALHDIATGYGLDETTLLNLLKKRGIN